MFIFEQLLNDSVQHHGVKIIIFMSPNVGTIYMIIF